MGVRESKMISCLLKVQHPKESYAVAKDCVLESFRASNSTSCEEVKFSTGFIEILSSINQSISKSISSSSTTMEDNIG
jgi:hypothetical protein